MTGRITIEVEIEYDYTPPVPPPRCSDPSAPAYGDPGDPGGIEYRVTSPEGWDLAWSDVIERALAEQVMADLDREGRRQDDRDCDD